MIWYDMIWYDMIWYDMIWYDIMLCFYAFVLMYDIGIKFYMIWYDMICYDMIVWIKVVFVKSKPSLLKC